MKPPRHRKRKEIKLTHELYNNLMDSRQAGACKIAKQLIFQGIDHSKVLRFLQSEGLTYHEAMNVIRQIERTEYNIQKIKS